MAQAHHLIRSLMLLGVIMFLAFEMFPSAPQFPVLAAPNFNNPFQVDTFTNPLHPVANSLPFSAPSVGCQNWTYYVCLQSNDANQSYIHLQFVNASNACYTNGTNPPDRCGIAVFNMQGGIPTKSTVTGFTISIVCRGTTATPAKFMIFIRALGERTTRQCSQSNDFQLLQFNYGGNVTGNIEPGGACYWSDIFAFAASGNPCTVDQDPTHFPGVQFAIEVCGINGICPDSDGISGEFDITYVHVDVRSETPSGATCSGTNDWFSNQACQIGRGVDTAVKMGIFFVNGIVFIFAWGQQFFGIVTTLISLLVWLYAIPGMPQPIQLLFDVYVTTNIIYLIFTVAQLVRGAASG